MSTFVNLGSRMVTGAADQTGRNIGKWTVAFSPDIINVNLPYCEVSHIVVNGAPGSQFTVWIDAQQWDTNQLGAANSWDPSVPLPLRPGQFLYFFYSDADTDSNPPVVTIWLRYDQDIAANNSALLGMGN
jgi:hypothetical protein